jgi:hypothetical protein
LEAHLPFDLYMRYILKWPEEEIDLIMKARDKQLLDSQANPEDYPFTQGHLQAKQLLETKLKGGQEEDKDSPFQKKKDNKKPAVPTS